MDMGLLDDVLSGIRQPGKRTGEAGSETEGTDASSSTSPSTPEQKRQQPLLMELLRRKRAGAKRS
jgi:hypothetical protein